MSIPGSDLSQPASVTEPSRRSANMTVSTLSAMTSRDTSDARIPSCPIEMPSETEMVPNSIGKPPAARTPSLAAFASRSSDRLQGVISFQEDATPICGLSMSSSVIPTARSIARCGARCMPSVTSVLRGLRGWPPGVAEVLVMRCPSGPERGRPVRPRAQVERWPDARRAGRRRGPRASIGG